MDDPFFSFKVITTSFFFRFTVKFLSVAYFSPANLVRLGISFCIWDLNSSQYLVRLLSLRWITGGLIIHPLIEGLLPVTGITVGKC